MEAAGAAQHTVSPGQETLYRGISQKMLFVFVLGDVLGAGIYALVGSVAGETGGAIWAAFLCATVLAVLTAFSYAEPRRSTPRPVAPRRT